MTFTGQKSFRLWIPPYIFNENPHIFKNHPEVLFKSDVKRKLRRKKLI